VALYSTFLQRTFDQILHDVALDGLPVVFCIDRAGLVGDDGPTHHGAFDLSFLRIIPGALIMAPRDEEQFRKMLFTALSYDKGPSFIRYPRGSGTGASLTSPLKALPIGTSEDLVKGENVALLAAGDFVQLALRAREFLVEKGINPAVIDPRFIKPLDEHRFSTLWNEFPFIVTLENNTIEGGFGSALLSLAAESGAKRFPRFLRLGLPDRFIQHGDLPHLLSDLRLDPASLADRIGNFVRGE
jgi:1-deoxy-D-xylulose-5-phosphate synthase